MAQEDSHFHEGVNMPVVRLYYEDLEEMVSASRDTIMARLPMMGADIGKSAAEDYVDVEFFPDRPDLYSSEGVARALQGFLRHKGRTQEIRCHARLSDDRGG